MRPVHAVRQPDGCQLFDALAFQRARLPFMLGTLVYIIQYEMNISTYSDPNHHSVRFNLTAVFIMRKLILISLLLSTSIEALAITKAQESTHSASLDERKEKRASSSSSLVQGSSIDTSTTFDVDYIRPTATRDVLSSVESPAQVAMAPNVYKVMDAIIRFLSGVIIILFQLTLIVVLVVPAHILAQLVLEAVQAYFCHGYSRI